MITLGYRHVSMYYFKTVNNDPEEKKNPQELCHLKGCCVEVFFLYEEGMNISLKETPCCRRKKTERAANR